MKKITSILSLVLIAVLAMSLFTGCGDKKKVIVMGTNAEFEPFEYMQGGKVVGFDVEIAKKVAEKLGAELIIENMQFASLITSLETKKIDFIAAGMTNNEERAKQVNFSMDYFTASQVIIVNKESDSVNSKADLEGKKIGVQLGTTGETEAKSVEGAEVKSYDTGYAADQEPAEKFVSKNDKIQILDEELTKEAYAIAVNKEDEELLATINEVIKEIQENGEYDKIYEQFFGKEEKEEE
jgi:polar amino acid transport system substrate-binding protein